MVHDSDHYDVHDDLVVVVDGDDHDRDGSLNVYGDDGDDHSTTTTVYLSYQKHGDPIRLIFVTHFREVIVPRYSN